MKSFWVILAFLCAFLSALEASAEDCLEEYLVLEHQESWNFSQSEFHSVSLPSRNQAGPYKTAAKMHMQNTKPQEIFTYFDFRLPPGQVSLAYNLYRVEVSLLAERKEILFQEDFTKACSEPGRSMFPGQEIHLPALKVPQNYWENGPQTLEVKIWGHL